MHTRAKELGVCIFFFWITITLSSRYECGQEKDAFCNFGCQDIECYTLKCPWNNSLILPQNGYNIHRDCSSSQCCTIPDPSYFCNPMEDWTDVVLKCINQKTCNVTFTPRPAEPDDRCDCDPDDACIGESVVSAVIWKCKPEYESIISEWRCGESYFGDSINCGDGLYIDILNSYHGISPCHGLPNTNQCCLDATDCLYEVLPSRLDLIRGYCNGEQVCDSRLRGTVTPGYACHGYQPLFNDYEIIYYQCVSATTLATTPSTTSTGISTSSTQITSTTASTDEVSTDSSSTEEITSTLPSENPTSTSEKLSSENPTSSQDSSTSSAASPEITLPTELPDGESVLIYVIAAVAVVLVIILTTVIVCLVCCIKRNKTPNSTTSNTVSAESATAAVQDKHQSTSNNYTNITKQNGDMPMHNYRHSKSGDVYAMPDKSEKSKRYKKTEDDTKEAVCVIPDSDAPDIVQCSTAVAEQGDTYYNLATVDNVRKISTSSQNNSAITTSMLHLNGYTTKEDETEDYYAIDQPPDQSKIYEAQRFQPGGHTTMDFLHSGGPNNDRGTKEAEYEYAYGHTTGGVRVQENSGIGESGSGEAYAEIPERPMEESNLAMGDDEEETVMTDNDTYG